MFPIIFEVLLHTAYEDYLSDLSICALNFVKKIAISKKFGYYRINTSIFSNENYHFNMCTVLMIYARNLNT